MKLLDKCKATLAVSLFVLLLTTSSAASEVCSDNPGITKRAYLHMQRGKVVSYILPSTYDVLPSDLVCAVTKQMWVHRDNIPDKLTIIVTNQAYRRTLILQSNLSANTMMLTSVDIPRGKKEVTTVWTMFPSPMDRFTEMLQNQELPIAIKSKTKANYVTVSIDDIKQLVLGKTPTRLEQRSVPYSTKGEVIKGFSIEEVD